MKKEKHKPLSRGIKVSLNNADDLSTASRLISRRLVALLLLLALSCFFSFYHLSAGTLLGDEAAFAASTDHILRSGDWIVPTVGARPHLNATPLYNWLTVLVSPIFEDSPFRHRFWSATFGVGCVLLTFALGTFLFRVEIGFLAGLLLAVNRDFLFCHGARFGGMDTLLAFWITGAVLAYAWLQESPHRFWRGWSLIGFCFGLACLSKPPAFGCFFLGLIGLHSLLGRRGETWSIRLGGPVLALGVGSLIAAPWYLMLWIRLGGDALHQLFIYNSVGRATDLSTYDFFCCQRAMWHASIGFKVLPLALLAAVVCGFLNHRRRSLNLLLYFSGAFLLTLSGVGQCFQYVFYVFPILAVLSSCLFLETGTRVLNWLQIQIRPQTIQRTLIGLAFVVVAIDVHRCVMGFRAFEWTHPPVGIYLRLESRIEQKKCRLVCYDFPTEESLAAIGLAGRNFEDAYFCPRMKLAEQVSTVEKLTAILKEEGPTLVILPPITQTQPDLTGLTPEVRIVQNRWPAYSYPVLFFHGASGVVSVEEIAQLCRAQK